MNVRAGRSANFEPVDGGDKVPATAAGPADRVAGATAARPADRVAGSKFFKIMTVILAAGITALWAAFLAWLAIRYIF